MTKSSHSLLFCAINTAVERVSGAAKLKNTSGQFDLDLMTLIKDSAPPLASSVFAVQSFFMQSHLDPSLHLSTPSVTTIGKKKKKTYTNNTV